MLPQGRGRWGVPQKRGMGVAQFVLRFGPGDVFKKEFCSQLAGKTVT